MGNRSVVAGTLERPAVAAGLVIAWAIGGAACQGPSGPTLSDAGDQPSGADGSVQEAGAGDAALGDASAMDATMDAARDGVRDAASDTMPLDGAPPDATSADASAAPMDAGTLIVVTPANSSRTILPGCVNGVMSRGILPPCMGSVGVGRGDRYAIRLDFREIYQTQRLSGRFNFDETTGGAYNAAISETPGSFDVPPACKDEAGFFPSILYLNQREIDETLRRFPTLTEADILANHCLIDPARTYYLNVDVVASCRKDDPSRAPCWASILQQGDQFQF